MRFFKLWSLGQLPGLEPPQYDSEQGQARVLNTGGVYETLRPPSQGHDKPGPQNNTCPKTDRRFVVDAWVTGEFDLDVPTYLTSPSKLWNAQRTKGRQLVVG